MKATCKVATDSKQIEVVLPVVPSNLFTGIDVEAQGASNQTDFNINLTECSNTEDQKLSSVLPVLQIALIKRSLTK